MEMSVFFVKHVWTSAIQSGASHTEPVSSWILNYEFAPIFSPKSQVSPVNWITNSKPIPNESLQIMGFLERSTGKLDLMQLEI